MAVWNWVALFFSFLELLCFAGVAFGYGFVNGHQFSFFFFAKHIRRLSKRHFDYFMNKINDLII